MWSLSWRWWKSDDFFVHRIRQTCLKTVEYWPIKDVPGFVHWGSINTQNVWLMLGLCSIITQKDISFMRFFLEIAAWWERSSITCNHQETVKGLNSVRKTVDAVLKYIYPFKRGYMLTAVGRTFSWNKYWFFGHDIEK